MQQENYAGLVIRAQRGDAQAFDCLVRRFQDRAVGYARAQLRFDLSAAEDAAQDAFVQAWRDLPTLQTPEAFPSWLRRIVFKYCDRIRRQPKLSVVPLDEAFYLSGGVEPARAFAAGENAARLRRALEALPEREREAALLYYRDEYDLAEIGAFLDVPDTTVKNRLHAARKRLRKELWEMAQEILEREKPSRDESFAGKILTRIMEEFRSQMRADPHSADRRLLAEGRETLDAALAKPGPLDWETVRAGFYILGKQDERLRIVSLLMRYVAQPLDDSSMAWAYYHLALYAAWSGSAAATVLAFEAFDRRLPGTNPRLAIDWPHAPVPAAEAAGTRFYEGPDEIRMLVLGLSVEFANAWRGVWREDDYLSLVNDQLQRVTPTDRNRQLRFSMMRMACAACQAGDRIDDARGYVERMYRLAEEPKDENDRARWRAKALGHDLGLCTQIGDAAGMREKVQALTELLSTANGDWVRVERHDLGCHLTWQGKQDLALPLFEHNLREGGHVNAWGYIMHAADLYHVTGDRERALKLIRDGAVRNETDLTADFQARPEFADVKNDPEFLAAVRKPE